MSEVPPPPEASQAKTEAPKSVFEPSFIAPDRQAILGIKDSTLRRRIHLLHDAALKEPQALNPELLEKEAKEIRDGVAAKRYKSEQVSAIANRLQKKANEMRDNRTPYEKAFPAAAKATETLASGLLGAALAEGADAVENIAGKFVGKESSHSNKEPEPVTVSPQKESKKDKEKDYSNMTYAELDSLDVASLTVEQKKQVNDEKQKLVTGLMSFDNGRFIERVQREVKNIVRENTWDDVYDKLVDFADNEESVFKRTRDDDPRWEGLLRSAVYAEAANLSIQGILREQSRNPSKVNSDWLKNHDYDNRRVSRLREDASKRIPRLDLLPADAAELVGKKRIEVDPSYNQAGGATNIQDFLRRMAMTEAQGASGAGEDRYVPIQAPDHVGASFKGGLFERMFKHETIPVLDIKDPQDRMTFILENIHAFDYIFNSPGQWLGALEAWRKDVYFAARKNGLGEREKEKFDELLKAAMAVTASARAMEKSNGSLEAYGIWLTTGGQGKEADLDVQDQLKDKILHEDGDKKIQLLLQNPEVREYYDRLMDDMGVVRDRPAGSFSLDKSITDIRAGGNRSKIVDYLKNEAAKGGFSAYIEKVLLRDVDPNSNDWDRKWAAAKLATDIVMVDGTFTLWEWNLTNGSVGEESIGLQRLKLFPLKNWGGDPLKSILKPSFLPVDIKGAYKNDPAGLSALGDLDRAFAPYDIFRSQNLDAASRFPTDPSKAPVLTRDRYQLKISMTENWKKMARWSRAHWIAIGGSQAEGLGVWGKDAGSNVVQQTLLLNQVFGGITETHRDGNVYPVGKHIVGAQIARLLVAKAKAYVTQRPGIIGGTFRARLMGSQSHPNYEALAILKGPDLANRSGLLRDLTSLPAGPIFGGNWFEAEKDLDRAIRILETNNPNA